MLAIFGGWALFVFLFLRIYSTIAFYTSLSLLGCLICGAATAAIIFFTTAWYSFCVTAWRRDLIYSDKPAAPLFVRFLLPVLVSLTLNFGACYLVAVGFSQRFFDREMGWSRYGGFFEQDLVGVAFMFSAPVFIHLLMVLFGIMTAREF